MRSRRRLADGKLGERPAGTGRGVERIGQAEGETFGARPGDHDAVVGAEPCRRRDQAKVVARRLRGEARCGWPGWPRRRRRSPGRRRSVSSADRARGRTGRHRVRRPVANDVDDRRLERRGEIVDVRVRQRRHLLRRQTQRGLQSGEREVGARLADQRSRQGETPAVAALCRGLDRRAAGIGRGRGVSRPCRRPRRAHRRWWCRAGGNGRRPRTATNWVWPPETRRRR